MPRVSSKNSANGPEYGSNGGNSQKKFVIDVGTTPENVIQLDANGGILVFETKDKFLQMSDDFVAQLSPENKLRYTHAKEFHDTWRGEEHDNLVEQLQIGRQFVGSATEKLEFVGPKNMVVRWTRRDRVPSRISKGWKVLGPDEIQTFLGPTGTHHEIGRLGETELVAMGIPKEIYDKAQKKKVARNNEMAGSWKAQALSEMSRAGGQAFAEEDDDRRRRWNEVSTDEG